MTLKPQDIVVLLKLVTLGQDSWSYAPVANTLFMSPSEVHSAVKRASAAGLIGLNTKMPIKSALQELLIYGVKYIFPPTKGRLTRGIPTAYAAPPLSHMVAQSDEPPPVWPHAAGMVRGLSFLPLYRSVPKAATVDQELYELLALVDAIRDGRAREREIATREIKKRV